MTTWMRELICRLEPGLQLCRACELRDGACRCSPEVRQSVGVVILR